MPSKQTSLLIDTNVWLDNYLPNREGSEKAVALITFASKYEYPLLYPAAVAKDVFYLSAHAFKKMIRAEKGALSSSDAAVATEAAWGCVQNMREQATAVGADESDLWMACKLRSIHNDLEDNLIVAAAERANATYLITSDEALIKHSPVATLTPSDALALLQAEMA